MDASTAGKLGTDELAIGSIVSEVDVVARSADADGDVSDSEPEEEAEE